MRSHLPFVSRQAGRNSTLNLRILLCLLALPLWAAARENPSAKDSQFVQAESRATEPQNKSRLDRLQLAAAAPIPVTSLPITITEPGTYVLPQDLVLDTSMDLQAVRIFSSDVILDCQGKRITATIAGSGSFGVTVGKVQRVTVMNCILEGFGYGIRGGAGGTDLQMLNNELRGGGDIGIYVAGNNTHVVGNRIIAQRYLDSDSSSGIGIMLASFDGTGSQPSTGALIQDNVIVGLKGRDRAVGIEIVGSVGAQVLGNKILDIGADNPGAYVYAIFLRASYRWPKPPGVDVLTSGTIIRNNELMLRQKPLNTFAYATDGIALEAAECVGNLSIGFAKAFSRCLAASNNIELGTLHPTAVNGSQPLLKSRTTPSSASMPAVSSSMPEQASGQDSVVRESGEPDPS